MCIVSQDNLQFSALILDLDQKAVLDRLPVAEGAAYDSHAEQHNATCLPKTRVDLLNQIKGWADDPSTTSIFWLNGMAGTGKSTISRTVAKTFAENGRLGASFFFKRGEADRGGLAKLFTTLAADLVVREPATASHIKDALDADPSIITKNAREQFDRLFQQPLSKATSATKDGPVVIIVDALDECDDDDIKLMIRLFSRTTTKQCQRIKIFLTSRPELPPRIGFKAIEGTYQGIVLHEMPDPVVERDISAFLEYELARIRGEYNASASCDQRLPLDWPKPSDIKSLAKMAVPLFIFAATVCRFIADRKYGNPEKQLMKVLSHQTKSHESMLAETYLVVLSQQIVGLKKLDENEMVQEFRNIVGPIVVLASPLSTSALARILGIPERTVDDRLALLHSVLSVPQSADSPVRLLHLSFRDFLLDSDKRQENIFWIDEKQTHANLAANCLRVLGCLKQDLCDVGAPGIPRSAINPKIIDTNLPPEVRYACLYWIYHMHQARIHIADGDSTHGFLTCHFLNWIEALSLIGRISEGLGLIRMLQSLLQVGSFASYSCVTG